MDLQLTIKAPGAEPWPLDDLNELDDVIEREAQVIADDAGSDLLDDPGAAARAQLKRRVVLEANAALTKPGDTYTDPTGVVWVLEARP